jgi:hypothetical protein
MRRTISNNYMFLKHMQLNIALLSHYSSTHRKQTVCHVLIYILYINLYIYLVSEHFAVAYQHIPARAI